MKSFGVIKSAVGLAANEFSRKKTDAEAQVIRTQRDISMKIIVIGIVIALLAVFLFFAFGYFVVRYHNASAIATIFGIK